MLIKNLQLRYSGREDSKVSFQTENGAEVLVDENLLENFQNDQGPLYLALDRQPLVSGQDKQKELLNELLNPEDQK